MVTKYLGKSKIYCKKFYYHTDAPDNNKTSFILSNVLRLQLIGHHAKCFNRSYEPSAYYVPDRCDP